MLKRGLTRHYLRYRKSPWGYNGRGTQAVAFVNMRVDASENEHPAFQHRDITLTDSAITEDLRFIDNSC